MSMVHGRRNVGAWLQESGAWQEESDAHLELNAALEALRAAEQQVVRAA